VHTIFVGELEGKVHLSNTHQDGRIIKKVDLKKTYCVGVEFID